MLLCWIVSSRTGVVGGRGWRLVAGGSGKKIELHASQQLLCPRLHSTAFESVSVRAYRRHKTTVIACRALGEK